MLVLPGGGYRRHAAHEGEPVARWLNAIGVAAFVLRYRVAPHRFPAPLHDAARAIRQIRHHQDRWSIDPTRVGVLGFSAGGHLAGLLATETGPLHRGTPDEIDLLDPRPDVAILCYPVATLVGPAAHADSVANLLGGPASYEQCAALSIDARVSPSTPPTFLWHTADDETVPAANALLVAGALARHNVPYELHIYPHGKHGLGLAEDDAAVGAWTASCARFLRDRGL